MSAYPGHEPASGDEAPLPPTLLDRAYFRRFQRTYPVGKPPVLLESEIIVTTAEVWATRPESDDPSWRTHDGAEPLVIASRLIA